MCGIWDINSQQLIRMNGYFAVHLGIHLPFNAVMNAHPESDWGFLKDNVKDCLEYSNSNILGKEVC